MLIKGYVNTNHTNEKCIDCGEPFKPGDAITVIVGNGELSKHYHAAACFPLKTVGDFVTKPRSIAVGRYGRIEQAK